MSSSKNIQCGDCGGRAPKVKIPAHTVSHGFGFCTGCLHAPECEGCGAHSVADKADIQGSDVKLCKECKGTLGATIIRAPLPAKPAKIKARKPAKVA